MRSAFFWLAAPFLCGIAFKECLSAYFAVHLLCFLVPALWFSKGSRIYLFLLCAAWFCLGGLHARAAGARPRDAVERFISPEPVRLTGTVRDLPEVKMKGRKRTVSFLLDSEQCGRVPAEGRVQVFLLNPRTVPPAGSRVSLYGKLEKPGSFGRNFDYENHLRSQGIYAVFQGIGWRSVFIKEISRPSWMTSVQAKIAGIIERFSSGQACVIYKALVLGTRAGLEPELKNAFFRSGTSHLLAISGLNIALVAGTFYALLIAFRIHRRAAAGLAAAATVFQVCAAGLGFPVLRAGYMACTGFFAIALDRPRHSLNTFFLALLAVLWMDPRSLWNVSFQLSFLSVFSMIVFFPLWEEWRWKELWAAPLAVGLGTFPAVLWHFGGISAVSWASNLLAVPLFHFTLLGVLAGLAFFWMPGAGFLFFGAAGIFLKLALAWIRFCASQPWSYWNLAPLSIPQMAAYYLSLAVLAGARAYWNFRKRKQSAGVPCGKKNLRFDGEATRRNKAFLRFSENIRSARSAPRPHPPAYK